MTQACNTHKCPTDCVVNEWSGWSECSAQCGEGIQQRTRQIVTPEKDDGDKCDALQDERTCEMQSCNQPCVLEDDWTEWSACSKVCNTGFQHRVKEVKIPAKFEGTCDAPGTVNVNFQEQECNAIECPSFLVCRSKLDLVLILDGSGSMGELGFDAEKVFAHSLLDRVELGEEAAKVGLISFSKTINTLSELSTDAATLKSKVDEATWPKGTTDTAEALNRAKQLLERGGRDDANSVVFIATDGDPNDGKLTAEAATALKETGARLVFVALGPRLDLTRVNTWATQPARDNVVKVDSAGKLEEYLSKFVADLCPLSEAFCPQSFAADGGEVTDGLNLADGDANLGATLGKLGGGFSFSATVRLDKLGRWARVFDFGAGAAQDNIVLNNVATTSTLGFWVFYGRRWDALFLPNFWVPGEENEILATISPAGLMRVWKNGEMVGEKQLKHTPRAVDRQNLFVGKSNWGHDDLWSGSISNVRVWNDEIGPDCTHGGGTWADELAAQQANEQEE